MAIDEQDFLREATVRMCSSLDIETALGRFLRYVEKFIPVSKMYLDIYELALGVLRNMATEKPTWI
jgi:hypothetical protein